MARSIAATSHYPPVLDNIDISSPLFFWRPSIGENCYLSQHYPSKFVEPDTHATHVFTHAEQYMMYHKALLLVGRSPYFTNEQQIEVLSPGTRGSNSPKIDDDLPEQVLASKKPANMKHLVSPSRVPFTHAQLSRWETIKFDVVCRASRAKFNHNRKPKQHLLASGLRELVEASSYDRIWGVGYGQDCALLNRMYWGTNMLGTALMLVRQEMMAA